MTRVQAALERAVADLDASGAAWALVGGFAVSARVEPRFTRDVDFAVAVADDAGAESLVREFVARGYRILAIAEQEDAKRIATVRFAAPGEDAQGVVVDLLFASSGLETEIAGRGERLEIFAGVRVPVATAADLIAMKILSRDDRRRPQDAQDLRSLITRFGEPEIAAARAALQTIARRGFARGKNLIEELANAVEEFRGDS